MTPSQSTQFDKYGCSCRSLIALANANYNPITKEAFIDKFIEHPQFWFWKTQNQCGLTDTGLVLDLIRGLNLGTSFQIFLNKDEVRRRMKTRQVSGVLLFTEKREEDGKGLTDNYHCSLIGANLGPNGEFLLIDVGPDCRPRGAVPLADSKIDELKGYFLLIQPERFS